MALTYQIGVDAGGTHSTAIAYDENGKELGRAEGGPGASSRRGSERGVNEAQAFDAVLDGGEVRLGPGPAALTYGDDGLGRLVVERREGFEVAFGMASGHA